MIDKIILLIDHNDVNTLLHIACKYNNVESVKLLLNNSSVNTFIKNHDNKQPLGI